MKNMAYKLSYCIGIALCICYAFIPSGKGVIDGENNALGAILEKPTVLVGLDNINLFESTPIVLAILIYWLPAVVLAVSAVLMFIINKHNINLIMTLIGAALFITADIMCICNEILYIGVFLNIIGVIITIASLLLCIVDSKFESDNGGGNKDDDISDFKEIDKPYGEIICTSGEFEGGVFRIEDSLILGHDAGKCNVVLSNKTVSRVHCIVKYIPETDTYTVKDVSRNGTYFENGQKLTHDYEMQVPRKTVIYIGKPKETFVLD